MNEIAGIGDNSEGAPVTDPLIERLSTTYKPQTDIRDELVAAFTRIPTQEITVYGKKVKAVTDPDWKAKVGVFVKKCRALATQAKDIHSDEKKDLLATTRKIDQWFLTDIIKAINELKEQAESFVGNFDASIIEAEEIRQAAIAKAAQDEADRLTREAEKKLDNARGEKTLAKAEAAIEVAENAQQVANMAQAEARSVDALEVTRTTSSAGVTQSTNIAWTGRILNLAEIDLNVLKADFKLSEIEDAVARFCKRTKGTQPVAGIVAERDFKSRTR